MKKVKFWTVVALVLALVISLNAAEGYLVYRGACAVWDDVKGHTSSEEEAPAMSPISDEKQNPATGVMDPNQAPISPLASGMTVGDDPEDVWLPAVMREVGGQRYSSKYLESNTSYVLEVEMPENFMADDENTVKVSYPGKLNAGGKTFIFTEFEAGGKSYLSMLTIEAVDDVMLVHGDENPQVYSGGEFEYSEENHTLQIYFYTSATEQHLRRPASVSRSASYGYLTLDFQRVI